MDTDSLSDGEGGGHAQTFVLNEDSSNKMARSKVQHEALLNYENCLERLKQLEQQKHELLQSFQALKVKEHLAKLQSLDQEFLIAKSKKRQGKKKIEELGLGLPILKQQKQQTQKMSKVKKKEIAIKLVHELRLSLQTPK